VGTAGGGPRLLQPRHDRPLRPNAAELAKQSQSGKGRKLDELLDKVKEIWAGDEVGPSIGGTPGLVLDANAYLTDYYSFMGEEAAKTVAGSAAKDAEAVRGYLAAFEGAGCDELILFPSASDPAQVDLLADAAGT
jgi:hypothetical protein